jgi:transcriptional regulator with XRE-family HTH domain
LHTAAGLSQRQLAKRVGTTASGICRLEDAEYARHSLAMLRRSAAALNRRVEIRLVPVRNQRPQSPLVALNQRKRLTPN